MGMNKTTFVIMGARVPNDQLPHDPFSSDEYLPYIEGWPDETLTMIVDHGGDHVFVGRLLASFDPYDDAHAKMIGPFDPFVIEAEIRAKIGIEVPAQLWAAEVYE